MSAELGRKRVSQTDPLQQAPQGRALCGLGTADTSFRRGSHGFPITAGRSRKSSVVALSAQIHKPCAESMDSALSYSHLVRFERSTRVFSSRDIASYSATL